jgi:hypothetical protein
MKRGTSDISADRPSHLDEKRDAIGGLARKLAFPVASFEEKRFECGERFWILGREKIVDRLADSLCAAQAIEVFRSLVPGDDMALQIPHEDAFVNEIENVRAVDPDG